jgi:hypothetical protein
MKNFLIALFWATFMFAGTACLAQTDDDQILHAKNALDVVHNCDDAMRFLNLVSTEGKQKPAYYLELAKANDCKSNFSQAIYYYNKFLEFQPASDSVKKRVAELSDEKAQKAKVAEESRLAREMYQSGSTGHKGNSSGHKDKKKRPTLYDNYYSLGIGYGFATGGDNAPYKNAFEISASDGFPVANNKLLLEFMFNSDFLINQNNTWFGNAFNIPASQVGSMGLCYSDNIVFGLLPVFINNKKLALAAGPMVGGNFLFLPTDASNDYSFSASDIFSIYYGIKANLFLGNTAVIYLQYAQLGSKTATATLPYGGENTLNSNYGQIMLGIRCRLTTWGFWW